MIDVQRDHAELGGIIIVPIVMREQDVPAPEPQLGEGEPGERAEQHGATVIAAGHDQRVDDRLADVLLRRAPWPMFDPQVAAGQQRRRGLVIRSLAGWPPTIM